MTNCSYYCQTDRLRIKALCRSRTADAPAVFATSVSRNAICLLGRTPWKLANNRVGKPVYELLVDFGLAFPPPFRLTEAPVGVRQTFRFGLLDGLRLSKNALAFIPIPSPAPLKNDRLQFRMFRGPACHRGVAARQKLQVIKIGACKAKRTTFPIQRNHPPSPQPLTALRALGIFANQKYKKLARLLGRSLLRFRLHNLNFAASRPRNRAASTMTNENA